ncbi:acyl-CoA carboxylase subunit epsilon [Kitasatospora sp. LaBMicrA B282]|uniref:acyl-CoA carboxylase subunit epsilon n=1 Tax=Kitasatospora sp. LaBMicrA B282 TaxID=3420949 RepID=UPI003D0EEA91
MPAIQVLHGQPTPEELATVLAVVQARAAAEAAAQAAGSTRGPASPWTDPARRIQPVPRPGANAWRTWGWAR